MRVNISCLLAFVLGCNVAAEIIHEVVEEKNPATLPCPHPVDKATWSRGTKGQKVDILTAGGDRDIRHNDPDRRFSSQADKFKSLYISRVSISDTGRYFCNNEPAADLTVIPSGTVFRLQATERTSFTLPCPPGVGGPDVPTWSKDAGDIQQLKGFYVSPVDKTLTITDLQPGDSGLYYCDGKPAAYLTVTRGETSDGGKKTPPPPTPATTTPPPPPTPATTTPPPPAPPPTTTTTTATTTTPPPTATTTTPPPTTITPATTSAKTWTPVTDTGSKTTTTSTTPTPQEQTDQQTPHGLVIGIVVSFLLVLLVIIIICVSRRKKSKREGNEDRYHVYDEIQDGSVKQLTNGLQSFPGPSATFCMTDFPGRSNQEDPTYSTIPDLKPVENKRGSSERINTDSDSVINKTFPAGSNKGSSQPTDGVYFLLEKPKIPANHSEQRL